MSEISTADLQQQNLGPSKFAAYQKPVTFNHASVLHSCYVSRRTHTDLVALSAIGNGVCTSDYGLDQLTLVQHP